MVEPKTDLPENVLLGIADFVGREASFETGDRAAWRGAENAIVERHQILRQRAAAGDAGAAEFLRIDLGSALQVVEGPHAVPNAIARRVATDQDRTDADGRVLRGRARERFPRVVQHLVTLTLPDRVIAQRRDAVARQGRGDPLIAGLAVGTITPGYGPFVVGKKSKAVT